MSQIEAHLLVAMQDWQPKLLAILLSFTTAYTAIVIAAVAAFR